MRWDLVALVTGESFQAAAITQTNGRTFFFLLYALSQAACVWCSSDLCVTFPRASLRELGLSCAGEEPRWRVFSRSCFPAAHLCAQSTLLCGSILLAPARRPGPTQSRLRRGVRGTGRPFHGGRGRCQEKFPAGAGTGPKGGQGSRDRAKAQGARPLGAVGR